MVDSVDTRVDSREREREYAYTPSKVYKVSGSSGASTGVRSRRGTIRERDWERDREREEDVYRYRAAQGLGDEDTEVETDLDEVSSRLLHSRSTPYGYPYPEDEDDPVISPRVLKFFINTLFDFCKLLSVVPAMFGVLYNLYFILHPPPTSKLSIVDYFMSALWAVLTGTQCYALTTGLLFRWQAYYPTSSTFIRLLALQGICWPATHFTLTFFNHSKRPIVCWALIGNTTCISRSVQMWVTSNLWWDGRKERFVRPPPPESVPRPMLVSGQRDRDGGVGGAGFIPHERMYEDRPEGIMRGGRRRWDWTEVLMKCLLPAALMHLVTAWALLLKIEARDC